MAALSPAPVTAHSTGGQQAAHCQKSSRKNTAHIVLIAAQMCFSGWHIVGSLAMKDGADPFVFVLYREFIASLLMLAYAQYCGLRIYIEPCDYVRFLILGFFSFVNVVGAMLALKFISASRFSIFQPLIPVIATFISVVVGLEKFSALKALGVSMAVGGAILAETWKSSSSGEDRNLLLGTVIVSIQVTGMACLIVFVKPVLNKYPPAVVTLCYYSVGSVYTLLLCCAWAYSLVPSDFDFDGHLLPWLALAYAATFATFFPYNAFSWAGKHLTPGITTVYCTFQPVGTIMLSLLILGSVITLSEGVGAVFVMLGLLVTVKAQREETNDHTAGSDEENSDSDEEGYEGGGKGRAIDLNDKLTFVAVPSDEYKVPVGR
jgi:drug/metabolite transporter (DMT)-like permease